MKHQETIAVGLIGFGEAAQAFVTGWRDQVTAAFTAFDIKTDGSQRERQGKLDDYAANEVTGYLTAAEAIAEADVVFSLVTPDQALAAAQGVAGRIRPGTLYFDCNSCAPQTKRIAETVIRDSGGDYLDVAVMAPVQPRLHRTPMLVSGEAVNRGMDVMRYLDMSAKEAPGGVGTASGIKLVRSIMVKGLEALCVECLLAGRHLGVEDTVFETLERTHPEFGWTERAAAMLARVSKHGVRRAAEMREAAAMVEQLGIPGRMARATTTWQQQIGELGLDPGGGDYTRQADRILAALLAQDGGKP